MRILVTGSEGFIGKNLVARLEQDGHEVIKYDKKIDRPTESYWIEKEPFDICYHLACMNQTEASKFPEENVEVNTLDTRKMALEAAAIGAKFVYTSTASVYGNAKSVPTPVSADLNPLTDYAVAKLAGEYFVKNSGADCVIYRLSNVYGPHQTLDNPYCGVIGRFIEQALAGKPLTIIGDGTQTRDFTFVDDVVDVLLNLENRKGVFNVSHGVETPVIKVAGAVIHALGKAVPVEFIEPRTIDGVQRRFLQSDLGCPTNLKTGIQKTVDWFLENKQS